MKKLAIIGTGIAGMGCAHFLKDDFDLTVYEKNDYVGGHTNTIAVDEDGKDVFFDTGFMVFNHVTYPLLTKLFNQLNVPTKKTSMSFSVQHVRSGLEYCGSGFNGLFAQRKNFFSLKFIRLLKQIARFNTVANDLIKNTPPVSHLPPPISGMGTMKEFCARHELGQEFIHKYLIPMSGAVWSTPPDKMLDFPAFTLIRFFYNHGFLGLNTQHQWYTVDGGSRMYRDKIISPIRKSIWANDPVEWVKRCGKGVQVVSGSGSEIYDKVILASHGDESYRMLKYRTPDEERLLSCFHYQENKATIHTDEAVMPRTRRAWSSWNYRIPADKEMDPSTIYWMNSLQGVSDKQNYFVSINDAHEIDPAKVIREIHYTHPLFDQKAVAAQAELPKLNEHGPVYFCGSYFRYGFHEDAFMSAVELCQHLLQRKVI